MSFPRIFSRLCVGNLFVLEILIWSLAFTGVLRADITVKYPDGLEGQYVIPVLNAVPGVPKDDRDFPVETTLNMGGSPVGNGIVFSLIRGGTFAMGSSSGDKDEAPVHNVTLDPFYITQYPITNAQYEMYTKEKNLSHNRGTYSTADDSPATNINYKDALDYMEWLDAKIREANAMPPRPPNPPGKTMVTFISLPTEAMWERASLGGDVPVGVFKKYPWGDTLDDDRKIYSPKGSLPSSKDASKTASPVPAGWGNRGRVFHMTGNVYGWCLDWYSPTYYKESPETNPWGPDEDTTKKCGRVIRGGTWTISSKSHRISDRSMAYPSSRNEKVGMRLVIFTY